MPAKRGDRAAPSPRPGEYDLRFANTESAKGWDELCRRAAANTRMAYDTIRADPRPASQSNRHHRLKHALAWGIHNNQTLEQWQYEVTGGGRIWYLVNDDTNPVWITYAGTGHPSATD